MAPTQDMPEESAPASTDPDTMSALAVAAKGQGDEMALLKQADPNSVKVVQDLLAAKLGGIDIPGLRPHKKKDPNDDPVVQLLSPSSGSVSNYDSSSSGSSGTGYSG